MGVFISADQAQGPNRYAYVGGNPETLTDPTGQRCGIPGPIPDAAGSGGLCGPPAPTPPPPPPGNCRHEGCKDTDGGGGGGIHGPNSEFQGVVDYILEQLARHGVPTDKLETILMAVETIISLITEGNGSNANASSGCGGIDHASCGTKVAFCFITSPCDQSESVHFGNRYLINDNVAPPGDKPCNQLCQEADALSGNAVAFGLIGGFLALGGIASIVAGLLPAIPTGGFTVPLAIFGGVASAVGLVFLALAGIYAKWSWDFSNQDQFGKTNGEYWYATWGLSGVTFYDESNVKCIIVYEGDSSYGGC